MTTKRYSFSQDPWAQAALVGGLSLIPTRKYPRWLRQTIVWAPAVATTSLVAVPGAVEASRRRLSQQQGKDSEQADTSDINPAARATIALAAGAAVYGVGRISLWSDTATENLLRKMRVPAPRVALSLVAATTTWWSVDYENKQDSQQDKGK